MATRAEPVSFDHVKALNMIDIEFYGIKEITTSWNKYRDHLNSYPQNNPKESDQKSWNDNTPENLTNLLFEMSKLLGFTFNKELLKKGSYIPDAHSIINIEQMVIRQRLAQLLTGNQTLKVELVNNTE